MKAHAIALVGCGKSKGSAPSAARDLYRSTLVRWSLEHAAERAERVYITSAFYGLVLPGAMVSPYELTLDAMARPEQCAWAARVVEAMGPVDPRPVLLLAGGTYAARLGDALQAAGWTIEAPLAGLQIGERLHWLKVEREIGRAA